jgi:anti-sigma regulatory factor (Ser/Thr protein kinase)
VRHAATNAVVVLRLSTDACLRVSEDSDSEWSDDIRPAEPHAVGGRGLYIVRSLAEKLEFERLDPGLAVSAVLPVRLREPRA